MMYIYFDGGRLLGVVSFSFEQIIEYYCTDLFRLSVYMFYHAAFINLVIIIHFSNLISCLIMT